MIHGKKHLLAGENAATPLGIANAKLAQRDEVRRACFLGKVKLPVGIASPASHQGRPADSICGTECEWGNKQFDKTEIFLAKLF